MRWIDWHRSGLLPLGPGLTADPRCRFVHGDFFALASQGGARSGPARTTVRRHPRRHRSFAGAPACSAKRIFLSSPTACAGSWLTSIPAGLRTLVRLTAPRRTATQRLAAVFAQAQAEAVTFYNPLQNCDFTQTVYIARTAKLRTEHRT